MRNVALKVPVFTGDGAGELIQRFQREARAAATLNHPHICPVYDVGAQDGIHYISMGHVDGRPLADYVDASHPQSEFAAAAVIRKVALALAEAHAKGIIHRDLKPSNIMIDQRREPIVMDFGLACTLDGADARTTSSGFAVGSPPYMSPERVEGRTDIGPETDIYSLGAVLYELLAGRPPFCGNALSVLHQVSQSDPPPLRELRPDLSPEIVAICSRAMARRPSDRFSSMSQFADALGAFLTAQSTAGGSWHGMRGSAAELETPPGGVRVMGRPASTPQVGSVSARETSPAERRDRPVLPAPWLVGAGAVGGALAVLAIVLAGNRNAGPDERAAPREHSGGVAGPIREGPGDAALDWNGDSPSQPPRAPEFDPAGPDRRPPPESDGPPPRDRGRPPPRDRFPPDWGFADYDRDGDGVLPAHELPRHIIHRADADGDEQLTAEEFDTARERMGRGLFAPPEHPPERGGEGRRPPPRGPRAAGRPPPP
jgi:hypothetical protein